MTQTWTTDDLASWLAHDLRTPLGAITGFAETLLDGGEMAPDLQREFLSIIYGESQRLARMVEQAVRLVRLEREVTGWQITDLSAGRWLEEGRRRAASELDSLGVTLETSPFEETLTVRGALRPLADALAGLLVGLGEFAGPGAILRLSVRAEGDAVTLSLHSDAFDLADDEVASAFQPFQRLGNAPRHDPVAAGLELALCAALVARHGGRTWARREEGGVCFGITQPREPDFLETLAETAPAPAPEPVAPAPQEDVIPAQPSPPRPTDRRHIPIVDDQPFIRRSLSLAMQRAGYQVSVAVNGAEGLERIRALRPGLVFLDLMMPVMDGFEVCRRVRTDPGLAGTRIIMLTAKGEALDEERGRSLGVDGYITKPFSPSAVVSRAQEILG